MHFTNSDWEGEFWGLLSSSFKHKLRQKKRSCFWQKCRQEVRCSQLSTQLVTLKTHRCFLTKGVKLTAHSHVKWEKSCWLPSGNPLLPALSDTTTQPGAGLSAVTGPSFVRAFQGGWSRFLYLCQLPSNQTFQKQVKYGALGE